MDLELEVVPQDQSTFAAGLARARVLVSFYQLISQYTISPNILIEIQFFFMKQEAMDMESKHL